MKKILLSVLLAITVVTSASARDYKIFNFGAKLGVNISSVTDINNLINSGKANFTGGVFFEFRPIKVIGLQIEALYTGSGFKTKPYLNDQVVDVTYNFIDVPLMARIYVIGGLSVNVGVQASFLFNPTLNFGEVRSQFDMNKAAFSIPVGLSYSFNFGLVIEARYSIGLTDVLSNYKYEGGTLENIRNSGIAVTVGWRF